MGDDRSDDEVEDEPQSELGEYDPEAEFRDPDSDTLTIPEVPTEKAGSTLREDIRSEMDSDEEDDSTSSSEVPTPGTDVHPELAKQFWALVLVLNFAVLAYALAAMFLFIEGEPTYAAYLLAAGFALTGFLIRRYRYVKRHDFPAEEDAADDECAERAERSDERAGGSDEHTEGPDERDSEP
ncbi:DUF7322 domain-containing protein [Natronolimnohabitans innermongolicus]|uniref:DUF7322 domain-containing protein n=1 Tax=Natronolimnohabitans innermongolicus JCM 12255 TaxID=1227499 RepID=L9XLQ6_9EURY|nr:hypothetical protein [Natronolimnohabitans innermongolicus]ELY61583.1 hypothetical protein C493_01926 [Natronolimnohabitans innermongolicus JCM 12255]